MLTAHRRRTLIARGAATLLVGGGIVTGTGAATADVAVYKNPHASPQSRAADLVRRMTLSEQIGQMVQIQVGKLYGSCGGYSPGPLNDTCATDVLTTDKVGSILSGGGDVPGAGYYPNTPQTWATQINALERYSIEHSRLHIPIIYGADVVHGHNDVLGATLFPQQIGLGASFDRGLTHSIQVSASKAAEATNVRWAFSPVADVDWNTRWGRFYESFGEDPRLSGPLAAASVDGLQSTGRVAASVKHFAAYAASDSGLDRTPIDMSMRFLEQFQLPSYEQAIKAGADSVMVNSSSVNGIPATASHFLLTTVLRKWYGFTGVTISDWNDVQALQTHYHIVPDYEHAIAASVNAGVDVTMEPYDADTFVTLTTQAVSDGLISKARIKQAAERVLAMKFKLGLFEHPYVNASNADRILGADTALARQAAAESSVLVKNDGSLPLSSSAKITVTGPTADSVADTLGGWSVGWQGPPSGSTVDAVTVLEGLRAAGGSNVSYVADQAGAVAAAGSTDAYVVALGRGPGAEGPNDQRDPTLPADQQALVSALTATGKPVIVVLLDDRPDVLGDALGANSILMAWRPGTEGGDGVADLLYGKANPSGRLPVTWPKRVTDQPNSYLYQTLPNTYNGTGPVYDPQYPFGWGLSYSTTSLSVTGVNAHAGTVTARVTVANTGGPAGDVSVPVYVSQPVSPVLVPVKRLVGFTRLHLDAGQSRTVKVSFPTNQLGVVPGDIESYGPLQVEHGQYVFSSGTATDTVTSKAANTLNL